MWEIRSFSQGSLEKSCLAKPKICGFVQLPLVESLMKSEVNSPLDIVKSGRDHFGAKLAYYIDTELTC